MENTTNIEIIGYYGYYLSTETISISQFIEFLNILTPSGVMNSFGHASNYKYNLKLFFTFFEKFLLQFGEEIKKYLIIFFAKIINIQIDSELDDISDVLYRNTLDDLNENILKLRPLKSFYSNYVETTRIINLNNPNEISLQFMNITPYQQNHKKHSQEVKRFVISFHIKVLYFLLFTANLPLKLISNQNDVEEFIRSKVLQLFYPIGLKIRYFNLFYHELVNALEGKGIYSSALIKRKNVTDFFSHMIMNNININFFENFVSHYLMFKQQSKEFNHILSYEENSYYYFNILKTYVVLQFSKNEINEDVKKLLEKNQLLLDKSHVSDDIKTKKLMKNIFYDFSLSLNNSSSSILESSRSSEKYDWTRCHFQHFTEHTWNSNTDQFDEYILTILFYYDLKNTFQKLDSENKITSDDYIINYDTEIQRCIDISKLTPKSIENEIISSLVKILHIRSTLNEPNAFSLTNYLFPHSVKNLQNLNFEIFRNNDRLTMAFINLFLIFSKEINLIDPQFAVDQTTILKYFYNFIVLKPSSESEYQNTNLYFGFMLNFYNILEIDYPENYFNILDYTTNFNDVQRQISVNMNFHIFIANWGFNSHYSNIKIMTNFVLSSLVALDQFFTYILLIEMENYKLWLNYISINLAVLTCFIRVLDDCHKKEECVLIPYYCLNAKCKKRVKIKTDDIKSNTFLISCSTCREENLILKLKQSLPLDNKNMIHIDEDVTLIIDNLIIIFANLLDIEQLSKYFEQRPNIINCIFYFKLFDMFLNFIKDNLEFLKREKKSEDIINKLMESSTRLQMSYEYFNSNPTDIKLVIKTLQLQEKIKLKIRKILYN
jgi:hypothetical protein